MSPDEKERFVVMMQAICAVHRVEPTEALLRGYWMSLEDVQLKDFVVGARRAIRDCTFLPKPAELRKLCGEITAELRAVIAFDYVRRAIASPGTYVSVQFDDPTIHAVVRSLGGWPALGKLSVDEFEKWTRAEFLRLYQAYAGNPPAELPDYLPGISETINAATGLAASQPVLIRTLEPVAIGAVSRETSTARELSGGE